VYPFVPFRLEGFEIDTVLAQLVLNQVLPRALGYPHLRNSLVRDCRVFFEQDRAVKRDHRRGVKIDPAMNEHLPDGSACMTSAKLS
jgi:hypothetical protein